MFRFRTHQPTPVTMLISIVLIGVKDAVPHCLFPASLDPRELTQIAGIPPDDLSISVCPGKLQIEITENELSHTAVAGLIRGCTGDGHFKFRELLLKIF